MTLSDWILNEMHTRLLIRMDLSRSLHGGPGIEAVQASIVGYHYDDDGPVMANIFYDCFAGSYIGHLDFVVESNPAKFSEMADGVISRWENVDNWAVRAEKVLNFRTSVRGGDRVRRSQLSASNVLVLQHLARIQGIIGHARRDGGPDEQAVMHTTARRLGSIIMQGNNQLEHLTKMS